MKKIAKFKKWIYFAAFFLVVLVGFFGAIDGDFAEKKWTQVFENIGLSDAHEKSNDVLGDFEVHFIDVGKADSIYIKSAKANVLIDAGDREPHDTVVNYLKNHNVSKLDLVVATHPHRDHIGQMADVINNFEISTFLEPDIPEEITPVTLTYEQMLKSLKNKNVNAKLAKAGENLVFDDFKIEVLGPISQGDSLNNNSIVLRVVYGGVSFLLTGDAEKTEENEILESGRNVKSDVLKVGHHGSNSSTSPKFLASVSPKYAVIPVSPDKSGAPTDKVLGRLKKFCGENIYRTDKNGTIIILTDGEKIGVKTQK